MAASCSGGHLIGSVTPSPREWPSRKPPVNLRLPNAFCQVGSTQLRYQLRCIDDLDGWLVEQGDWVDLGAAEEQKPANEGTVEAWGRSAENPVGGWYGLRKGYRGRFGMYLPPLLEVLGKVGLTHEARNNRSAPSSESDAVLSPFCGR